MIKLKGGRRVKPKQMYIYMTSSKWHDFNVEYQEQWESSELKTHTHIWVDNDKNNLLVEDLFAYMITGGIPNIPYKTKHIAFLLGFTVNDDTLNFKEPHYCIEIVVTRKISQTLINEVMDWLDYIVYHFIPHVNMLSLFGPEEGENDILG